MPRGTYTMPCQLRSAAPQNPPSNLLTGVDDFGVQYKDRHNAEHLLTTLQEYYQVTMDWTGAKFVGIDLAWNYLKRTCGLTMDGYITYVCTRFNHPNPCRPQHLPHKHCWIVYGAKAQLVVDDVDTSPPLDTK